MDTIIPTVFPFLRSLSSLSRGPSPGSLSWTSLSRYTPVTTKTEDTGGWVGGGKVRIEDHSVWVTPVLSTTFLGSRLPVPKTSLRTQVHSSRSVKGMDRKQLGRRVTRIRGGRHPTTPTTRHPGHSVPSRRANPRPTPERNL